MRRLLLVLLTFLQWNFATSKTITYDWTVSWVTANPDGLADRQVVGINGQWPLPVIEGNKGDQVIVNMHNGLGDKNATIHFHGMYQNGTTDMDGPSMVTQCPVPPGQNFTYNFALNQNGTYWYHCHVDYCYPDGYRQALIIHDKDAYFHDEIADDITITVSDWYHELSSDIRPQFQTLYNPTGAEPLPQSFLFNDTQNTSIPVQPGKTYLLRLINIGAFVAQYFYIEGHNMTIVEIDGVYTEPTPADILYIAVAQRYAVLVTMNNDTTQNYPIVTIADSVLLDVIPSNLQLNNTNWLEYNSSAPFPQANITVDSPTELAPFDDMGLVPWDHMPLLQEPDIVINVTVNFQILDNGLDYSFLNNITYTAPRVPTLYTVLSSGNQVNNQEIYGEFTHSRVLKHMDVVEIILNNADTGTHPFHLHGHNFQMVYRSPTYGPDFYSNQGNPVPFDPTTVNASSAAISPARRDTFVVAPGGYWVARFVADNPGVWFFHCHIDWHLAQGLGMLMVEAPDVLQSQLKVPQQHFDTCAAAGVAYKGNAAGNDFDLDDLYGENVQYPWLPAGFTPRGYVALVFSVFSACLGMGTIILYGWLEPRAKKHDVVSDDGVLVGTVDPEVQEDSKHGIVGTGKEVPPTPLRENGAGELVSDSQSQEIEK